MHTRNCHKLHLFFLQVRGGPSLVIQWLRLCLSIQGSDPWWVQSLVRELRAQCLRPKRPECKEQKQFRNKFNNSIKALKLKRRRKEDKDHGGNSLVGQWLRLSIFTGSVSDQGIKILQVVLCGKKKKKRLEIKK